MLPFWFVNHLLMSQKVEHMPGVDHQLQGGKEDIPLYHVYAKYERHSSPLQIFENLNSLRCLGDNSSSHVDTI